LSTGVQLPKQAIQDAAMVSPRMAASRAWLWQIGFEQQILLISQFMSAHQHISFLHADTLLLQIVCHRYRVAGQNLALPVAGSAKESERAGACGGPPARTKTPAAKLLS
jgi:hypothetical protein